MKTYNHSELPKVGSVWKVRLANEKSTWSTDVIIKDIILTSDALQWVVYEQKLEESTPLLNACSVEVFLKWYVGTLHL